MSSINLNVVGAETFGARLPTVFIQSIEVDHLEAPYDAFQESAKITATLSIKFTKPPHLAQLGTKEFIGNHLNNLKLYAYIISNQLGPVNDLENESLDLLEWYSYLDFWDVSGKDTDAISFQNTLKNLANGDDGASLILNNSFDGEGNEIIEISGITCEFAYRYSHGSTIFDPDMGVKLEDVEKLFFFATVGIKRSEIEDTGYTDTYESGVPVEGTLFGKAKTASNQTYNSFLAI